ncbi:MAG: hypothetical protein Fur009_1070 [Candidatus Microgenomates bacterium]
MSLIEFQKSLKNMSLEQFRRKWRREFEQFLPQYFSQITKFFSDEEFGLRHSYDVFSRAFQLADKVEEYEKKPVNREVIEYIAVFHDIGKFFQEIHSLENIQIAKEVFVVYATNKSVPPEIADVVIDGIRNSDFYNRRLDPSSDSPKTIEGEIVRAADKMLDNLVKKVDRYWYDYGVPRNLKFFDPNITFEERAKFSFDNFSGDQLNVILSIIGLRPEDFSHPVIQEEYRRWSKKAKKKVVTRIISLAREIGEPEENIKKIQEIIKWYRKTFNC